MDVTLSPDLVNKAEIFTGVSGQTFLQTFHSLGEDELAMTILVFY